MVKEGKKITGPEQLKDAASGCARIRGDTLGIVGLGKYFFFVCDFQTLWEDEGKFSWKLRNRNF